MTQDTDYEKTIEQYAMNQERDRIIEYIEQQIEEGNVCSWYDALALLADDLRSNRHRETP